MINKVILIGNLGKDPELKTFDSGNSLASFSVATFENYKDKEGEWQQLTEWHDIVAWRGLAERAAQSLKKGSMIYLEGKLTHRSYDDKDGNKRYVTEVVASYFRRLDKRESSTDEMPFYADTPVKKSAANLPSIDDATFGKLIKIIENQEVVRDKRGVLINAEYVRERYALTDKQDAELVAASDDLPF